LCSLPSALRLATSLVDCRARKIGTQAWCSEKTIEIPADQPAVENRRSVVDYLIQRGIKAAGDQFLPVSEILKKNQRADFLRRLKCSLLTSLYHDNPPPLLLCHAPPLLPTCISVYAYLSNHKFQGQQTSPYAFIIPQSIKSTVCSCSFVTSQVATLLNISSPVFRHNE
jgi:hypothetical protein